MSLKISLNGHIILSRDSAKTLYQDIRAKVNYVLSQTALKAKINFAVDAELIYMAWEDVPSFADEQDPIEAVRAVYFGEVTDYWGYVTLDDDNNLRNIDFDKDVLNSDLIDSVMLHNRVRLVAESEDVEFSISKLRLNYALDRFFSLCETKAEFETMLTLDNIVRNKEDETTPLITTEKALVEWIVDNFAVKLEL